MCAKQYIVDDSHTNIVALSNNIPKPDSLRNPLDLTQTHRSFPTYFGLKTHVIYVEIFHFRFKNHVFLV